MRVACVLQRSTHEHVLHTQIHRYARRWSLIDHHQRFVIKLQIYRFNLPIKCIRGVHKHSMIFDSIPLRLCYILYSSEIMRYIFETFGEVFHSCLFKECPHLPVKNEGPENQNIWVDSLMQYFCAHLICGKQILIYAYAYHIIDNLEIYIQRKSSDSFLR